VRCGGGVPSSSGFLGGIFIGDASGKVFFVFLLVISIYEETVFLSRAVIFIANFSKSGPARRDRLGMQHDKWLISEMKSGGGGRKLGCGIKSE
jgi:hypothetical protein